MNWRILRSCGKEENAVTKSTNPSEMPKLKRGASLTLIVSAKINVKDPNDNARN